MFFLLPYGNDRPTRRFPAVTYALIATNVLIYLWMLPLDPRSVVDSLGLVASNPSVRDTLTSMFLHDGLLHLGWNMLFLWLFGPNVEDALGHLEYLILYFGNGFAAALLHVLVTSGFTPESATTPMIGASGAIAGILGIFAVRFYKTQIRVAYFVFMFVFIRWGTFGIPAWIGLGIWLGQQLLGGFLGLIAPEGGGVAYWAHIGGMAFGMLLASVLRLGVEGTKEYLMTDARASLAMGTTWGAAEKLLELLEREPENPEVHTELARTYLAQRHHDQAAAHYRTGIELYLMRGDRDKAVELFAEMKERYPDVRLPLKCECQLANHLLEAGNRLAGLIMLEAIADTYRGTPEAETSLLRAGRIYLTQLGQPRAAAYCLESFLRDYPQSHYRSTAEKLLVEARAKAQDSQTPGMG